MIGGAGKSTAELAHEQALEAELLDRLKQHAVIHVLAPERVAAAQRLMRRGEVAADWGTGKDAGILLVRKSSPWNRPRGGDVA